jgi:SAM-dependent methyltransferase
MFNSDEVNYWKTEGINNLRIVGAPEIYEGIDTVLRVVDVVGCGTIRDIGCGYGRLAPFFKPEKYIGYDICEAAIRKAKRLKVGYEFHHWNFEELPFTDVTMFVNGPFCVNHDEIADFIKIITKNTNALVFGEIMNPSWINPSWINPPITPAKEYRRDISSYDNLLEPYGFIRKKTEITIQEYWGLPYTIARWENAKIIQS